MKRGDKQQKIARSLIALDKLSILNLILPSEKKKVHNPSISDLQY